MYITVKTTDPRRPSMSPGRNERLLKTEEQDEHTSCPQKHVSETIFKVLRKRPSKFLEKLLLIYKSMHSQSYFQSEGERETSDGY